MKEKLNIPNLLTLIRLILSGFIIYFILLGENITALVLFALAALTEFDGTIARKLNQETVFGNYFDAVTDIFWLVGTLVSFVIVGRVPLWVVVILAAIGIYLSVLVLIIARKKKKKIDISFHRPMDLVAGMFFLIYLAFLFLELAYSYVAASVFIVMWVLSSFNYLKEAFWD